MKILFICKKNETYGFTTYTRKSSGLYNSTSFIVRALREKGFEADIVEAVDNNCIDRIVTEFSPDICVIEALWVVPEKFDVLKQLHPNIKWFVHLHSHMAFLALEGIAIEWVLGSIKRGVGIIANSRPAYEALRAIIKPYRYFNKQGFNPLIFLPNIYIPHHVSRRLEYKDALDIGCFGAVRPLKNQLLQALAAIKYAKIMDKKLRFHINGTRSETGGDPVLKNIKELFKDTPNTELVMHPWYNPSEFLKCLKGIDIGMQVSLTETFNVVCADYATAGVPIVTSKEVTWVSKLCWAQDDSIDSIVHRMHRVYKNGFLVWLNRFYLKCHMRKAIFLWTRFVYEETGKIKN